MHILVINSGSSSIKFSVFEANEGAATAVPASLLSGELTGVGGKNADLIVRTNGAPDGHSTADAETSGKAIQVVVDAVKDANVPAADAVGYRVVHPGPKLDQHVRITEEVLHELDAAAEFAPLHDPGSVMMIRSMMERSPEVPRYACFDTIFHQTMPEEAKIYALPQSIRDQGVRRYGFHGLSCESIVWQMLRETGSFPRRAVIAHLGSGCSVTALEDGRSVDTTMGLTPTGGVVMGTRPGDLDPGLMLYLLRQRGGSAGAAASEVEKMVNHDAGMIALSGMENDVKKVREAAAKGNEQAQQALKVFTRSVRKAIGGYAWLLGGLDAVIFSGGIGEHDAQTRLDVLFGLKESGVVLDEAANGRSGKGARRIGAANAKTQVWVVPAEEDLMIAMHVERMARESVKLGEAQPALQA